MSVDFFPVGGSNLHRLGHPEPTIPEECAKCFASSVVVAGYRLKRVRGHRAGSTDSGAEGYLRKTTVSANRKWLEAKTIKSKKKQVHVHIIRTRYYDLYVPGTTTLLYQVILHTVHICINASDVLGVLLVHTIWVHGTSNLYYIKNMFLRVHR